MRVKVILENGHNTDNVVNRLREAVDDYNPCFDVTIERQLAPALRWSDMIERIRFITAKPAAILAADPGIDWAIYAAIDVLKLETKTTTMFHEELLAIAVQKRDGPQWVGSHRITQNYDEDHIADQMKIIFGALFYIEGREKKIELDIEQEDMVAIICAVLHAACNASAMTPPSEKRHATF
ncbi:hypothetical protein FJY93_03085 [Candidatus Kaiserbacteria bacterium]|nr:hypothetical protein [Candidatus Kaiserbacteria bacterium]